MAKKAERPLNTAEIAKALGVTANTVRHWCLPDHKPTPCPHTHLGRGRGKGLRFNLGEVNKWNETRDGRTIAELDRALKIARTHNEELKGQRLELDLAQRRGELIPREEMQSEWAEAANTVRAAMLGVPQRAAELGEHKPADELEQLIKDELYAAMERLSRS